MLKKTCYIIIALYWLAAGAFAQSHPALLFSHVSEENGLSDNHVQCVYRDTKGFLWIGTSNGLNKMDGSVLKIFKHRDNDSGSLPHNDIRSVAEDKQGNIWIATANGGMGYLPAGNTSFHNVNLVASPYGNAGIVTSLAVDSQDNVWAGTNGGLYVYSPTLKRTLPFLNETPGENKKFVNNLNTILLGRDGKLWLASFDGLWSFDINLHRYKREVSPANDAAYEGLTTSIYENEEGRLWFGNWSNGLKELSRPTGKVRDLMKEKGGSSNIVTLNEFEQPGGEHVLIYNGKLPGFLVKEEQFFQYVKPLGLADYPDITHIDKSPDGWIWFCSNKGLFIYNPRRQHFRHHFPPGGITSQGVSLIEWKDKLLVGGEGPEFLKAYDHQWNLANDFKAVLDKLPAGKSKANVAALSLVKEGEDLLWIGNSEGIAKINLLTRKSSWFSQEENEPNTLPRNFIDHLFFDSRKQLWVFPWRQGIWVMDTINGNCTRLFTGFLLEAGSTKGLVITSSAEDDEGNIWMTDLDEGIILYDRGTHSFSKPFEKKLGIRYRSSRIYFHDHYCYSYADGQILKWSPSTKALQQFFLPQEMNSDIFDMVYDHDNNWWVATNNGMVCFTESTGTFRRFTTTDGLYSNTMRGNFLILKNGDIIYGDPEYFTTFNPSSLLSSVTYSPSITLTGIYVNGQATGWDSTKELHLGYTENNIVFNWAIQDYANPFHNLYYCKLVGIDKEWRYVGNIGEVQYANLNAGNYQLLLKAATANGVISDHNLDIHFSISLPFWRTGWFWLIILMVIALIITWAVIKRIRSIKRKAALQQKISELEMKALRAQMNPHFIFNSLSSIQESIVTGKTDAASKYLGKFSKLIRMVLENSGRKFISLTDEMTYLRLYLELESFRFENFSFSIVADDETDTSFIRISPMIIQPYVENALKHGLAHKDGEKILSIHFFHSPENQLGVIITDNGIGRKSSALINASRQPGHHSLGMQITEQRLILLHENSKSPVEITDLYDDEGNPAGTRIKLFLNYPAEK